jgi:hypothetical protein
MAKVNKTLGITLRFFTNDVAVDKNGKKVLACWDLGCAAIEANKEKGIKAATVRFNCPEDIQPAIKELLRKSKIFMVSGNGLPRVLSHKRKRA